MLRTVAPTNLPSPKASDLFQRLHASNKLQELISLAGFDESVGVVEWTCCALSHGKTVTILCLPCGFYHYSSSLSPSSSSLSSFSSSPPCTLRGGEAISAVASSPQPLCLPLLLLQVDQEDILHPISSSSSLTEADSCLQLDLVASLPSLPQEGKEKKDCRDHQAELLHRVAGLHKACYLELLHSALTAQLTLSSQDFLLGLRVCQHSTVSLDTTALLSALCPHSCTSISAKPELGLLSLPLQADVLCQLLGATLSKQEWSVSVLARGVQEGEDDESLCSQCSRELNQVFLAQLTKLGFKPVSGCDPGYFWLDSNSMTNSMTTHGKDRVSRVHQTVSKWVVDHVSYVCIG